jgi:hypothetical protein
MNENELKPGFSAPETASTYNPQETASVASGVPAASTYSGQPDDLHDLFGTKENFNADDQDDPLAELRNDPNYAALIRDLEYIAVQARAIFASSEEAPSDDVWTKIQSKLTEESSTK